MIIRKEDMVMILNGLLNNGLIYSRIIILGHSNNFLIKFSFSFLLIISLNLLDKNSLVK